MEESNFNKEFTLKKIRLIEYLESKSLDGILMTKRSNYSWITCGYRNKIMDASQLGASSILFYKDIFYLITTNIEIERMISEELNNFFPIEKVIYDWFSPDGLKESLKKVTGLKKIVQDCLAVEGLNIVENDFDYLKFDLTEQELIRYAELGQIVSKCMTEVCFNLNQDMTELEVQGILSNNLISNGVMPLVILVGSDDRIFKYRHPVPTTKKIEKYIMAVVGAEKWGLIVAITRFVHFGALSADLEKIREDTIYIDADMILNSRPGIRYSEILERAAANYNKLGYRDEWKKHHQGGPIGYEGRYFLTTFNNTSDIEENHAIAWNPSITGFKSEDTFIVGKTGNNLISLDDKWPLVKVECKEKNILRADILIK